MKTLLALLILAAPSALSQTWTTIVPAKQQSQTISAMLPEGVTYRFVSVNGKATAPLVSTGEHSISDWADGTPGHPRDPDKGVQKAFQVADGPVAITINVIDVSVTPAKVTRVLIPAAPKPKKAKK